MPSHELSNETFSPRRKAAVFARALSGIAGESATSHTQCGASSEVRRFVSYSRRLQFESLLGCYELHRRRHTSQLNIYQIRFQFVETTASCNASLSALDSDRAQCPAAFLLHRLTGSQESDLQPDCHNRSRSPSLKPSVFETLSNRA